ncbi:uncharacterized protein LOC126739163 [Anthonomus grandis grandis]|uniref:uncharacterized protein LOC126739163 n=1 Tax=Anthonomus grandis grandis TaxID=2921223 RepID=UPI0021656321|nr:uncharacterized protein LOC126739163 [Anthonomus grandis grandis]
MAHLNRSPSSSEDEDEVTFLLRFKPAPTPPTRRRKNLLPPTGTAISTPNGWDVVIEKKDSPSRSVCSSPVRQRRSSVEECPPPVPPRFKPSAPPQEVDGYSWWGQYPGGFPGNSYYNMVPYGIDFDKINGNAGKNGCLLDLANKIVACIILLIQYLIGKVLN